MLDLAPILAAPDDDAPRLALAQKLRGDPLGTFLKLQCTSPGSPAAEKLLRAHYETWVGRKVAGAIDAMSAQFVRGFLDAIAFEHSMHADLSGPKILACLGQQSLSLVRRVTFIGGAGGADASRALNEAGKVLRGSPAKGPKIPAVRLLRDEVMERVREVRGLDDAAVIELARGRPLKLEVLTHCTRPNALPDGALSTEAVVALGTAPGLPRLRALSIERCWPEELEDLAAVPLVARLEALTFARFPGKDFTALPAALELPVKRLAFVDRQRFDHRHELIEERSLRLERDGASWRATLSIPAGPDKKDTVKRLEKLLASTKKIRRRA